MLATAMTAITTASVATARLWCVFELAAYRKANPDGRMVLAPLFIEAGVLLRLGDPKLQTSILWNNLNLADVTLCFRKLLPRSLLGTYFAAFLFAVGFALDWQSLEIRFVGYVLGWPCCESGWGVWVHDY